MIRSRKPMFLPYVMKTRSFRPLFRVKPAQNEVTFLLTQENRAPPRDKKALPQPQKSGIIVTPPDENCSKI